MSSGYNIETMDQFMPIATFDAVYLVDLCQPLLEVARKRFKERRWKNVHVVHCDATKFELPLDKYGRQCKAALITMSYSLSMVRRMIFARKARFELIDVTSLDSPVSRYPGPDARYAGS
jgi:betaine lipid synthase